MDLNQIYHQGHHIKSYERRMWWSMFIAILVHILTVWWFSQQSATTVPTLPDWMQVNLVAGLETPTKSQRNKPQTENKQQIKTRREPKNKASKTTQSASATAQAQDVVQANHQPQILDNPKPVYPAAAKRRGMQGTVILELQVSTRGKVTAVQLKKSSGYRVLDIAAIDGVKHWRFIPAPNAEDETVSIVEVPIRFELKTL